MERKKSFSRVVSISHFESSSGKGYLFWQTVDTAKELVCIKLTLACVNISPFPCGITPATVYTICVNIWGTTNNPSQFSSRPDYLWHTLLKMGKVTSNFHVKICFSQLLQRCTFCSMLDNSSGLPALVPGMDRASHTKGLVNAVFKTFHVVVCISKQCTGIPAFVAGAVCEDSKHRHLLSRMCDNTSCTQPFADIPCCL